MKFAHKFGVGSSLKTYLRIFLVHPSKFGGENLKFRRTSADRQSEARNFETAQHTDKNHTVYLQ